MTACNARPPEGHPFHGTLVACHLAAEHVAADIPHSWDVAAAAERHAMLMDEPSPLDPLPICLGCWRRRFGMDEDPGPPHRPPEVETCAVCGGPTNYGLYLLRGKPE